MTVSVFDLFKIGVGPSSSHTVGPMVAARRFGLHVEAAGLSERTARLRCDLYGSLALTGKGHASDVALIAGLAGERPDGTSADAIARIVDHATTDHRISMLGRWPVAFDPAADIAFHQRERLPFHSNAMAFEALDEHGAVLVRRIYYSVGGGFVLDEDEAGRNSPDPGDEAKIPYAFASGAELLDLCDQARLSIADLVLANEVARRPLAEVEARLDRIADAMSACIEAGITATAPVLPGELRVKRRAPKLAAEIAGKGDGDPLAAMDALNLWAMAVNEENAAGGRVVTAPTNGAAGIIPSVVRYYERMCGGDRAGVRRFLLAAAAIGALYRRNASISGAEVGCQGEVGVACSMAAAGLTAALGGSNGQVENAAEIGMEHNLGLTCDPVAGLVQVPCIERNAIGAAKAVNASRLAMMGDGSHLVSLDQVIETMRQTGLDMQTKYKETSRGGLAVNVVEC
ncbi:L-serine ammonia-lyase [Sphingomonas sp. ID0503]|uniref:L-serine ammonia-lyase n=1 Tax=Sphingomonas sp. ID0503 TaxID=3399691 RepID=UPI003AFA045B